MNLRKLLTENGKKSIESVWDSTTAASDLKPIPRGVYEARLLKADVGESSTGTARVALKFEILGGEFEDRLAWSNLWLTEAGMQYTKRDLRKLAVHSLDELEKPLPKHHICSISVVLRKSDNGNEYNAIKSFEVIRFEPEEDDPFAPQTQPAGPPSTPAPQVANPPTANLAITNPPLVTPTLNPPQKESATSIVPTGEAPPVSARPNTIDASSRRPGTRWGGGNDKNQ